MKQIFKKDKLSEKDIEFEKVKKRWRTPLISN
jgi:hypothetical protein